MCAKFLKMNFHFLLIVFIFVKPDIFAENFQFYICLFSKNYNSFLLWRIQSVNRSLIIHAIGSFRHVHRLVHLIQMPFAPKQSELHTNDVLFAFNHTHTKAYIHTHTYIHTAVYEYISDIVFWQNYWLLLCHKNALRPVSPLT